MNQNATIRGTAPFSFGFVAKNKIADAKRGLRDRLELENQLALAA